MHNCTRARDILMQHGLVQAAAEPVKTNTHNSMDVFLDLVDRVEHRGLHQIQFQGQTVHLSPCPDVNMTMGDASLTGLVLQADGMPRARIAFRGSVKKPEHRAIYVMVTGGITDLLKDLDGLDIKQMLALLVRTYLQHAKQDQKSTAAAEPHAGFHGDVDGVRRELERIGLKPDHNDTNFYSAYGDMDNAVTVFIAYDEAEISVRVLQGDVVAYRFPITPMQFKHIAGAWKKLDSRIPALHVEVNNRINHAIDTGTEQVKAVLRSIKPTKDVSVIYFDRDSSSIVVDDGSGRYAR